MNPIIQKRYDKAGPRVAAALSRRNMEAFYCPTAIEGAQKVLELIAPEDVVSWGGAMTADEMNLKELLRRRGQPVIDRDTAATPAERQELMRKALTCDTFLMSSNAISEDGQLVNIDGNGNRVAAMLFGPKKVLVFAGCNKIVRDIDDAAKRVKSCATPANAMRLNLDTPCTHGACPGTDGELCAGCRSENRICAMYTVLACQRVKGRIHVILIGEEVGY